MRIGDKWVSLNALHTFEAAGRLLHMGRAADELGVTQSAVSHQIRALEMSLGTTLFDRTGRRSALTADGRRLLETVQKSFGDIAATGRRLGAGDVQDVLTVAVPPSFSTQWLMPRVSRFLDRYPSLTLRRVDLPAAPDVIPPEIDIAIVFGDHHVLRERVTVLVDLHMFPVCAPTLTKGLVDLDAEFLRHQTFIHEDGGELWQIWRDQYSAPDIQPGKEIFAGANQDAIELARSGAGLALSDQFLGASLLGAGALLRPFGSLAMTRGRYYLGSAARDQMRPAALDFEDWLVREIAAAGSDART